MKSKKISQFSREILENQHQKVGQSCKLGLDYFFNRPLSKLKKTSRFFAVNIVPFSPVQKMEETMKKTILTLLLALFFAPCFAQEKELALKLHEIGAVKFGSFKLKSGILSPIYVDLRVIISDPQLLKEIGEAIWQKLEGVPCDCLCGVPYTALPIATAISLEHNIPMVMRRKEAKDYGTKKIIEGIFQAGQRCVVIEDLVTSGGSVLETIQPLENEGLIVTDVAVLIDREQGGRQKLQEMGYKLHYVLTLPVLIDILEQEEKITHESAESVRQFLQGGV
jgi:orotate phosphoribosyltransferase